jgi:hypothetical protein
MNDFSISKTLPVRPRLPELPVAITEESHYQWCREMGEYIAKAGYNQDSLKQLGRGLTTYSRQALREGYKKAIAKPD